ncbi:hypothetical protein L1049_012764 [Liquidambar formosana]|uniref:Uncharacterized protein n=1 Tax=Liquidambar formosana TaxID=63359 RepID=A0AAP0RJ97_LIQFO
MKLDRSLCNSTWLDIWVESYYLALLKYCSDNCPLLFVANKITSSGARPFRFINAWTMHPSFKDFVSKSLSSNSFYGCPMFILQGKLKLLKQRLKVWNKEVFGNIDDRVKSLQTSLYEVQQEIDCLGSNDGLLEKEASIQSLLFEALRIQETFWKDKSKLRWLADGDRNSSIFHSFAKVRAAKNNLGAIRNGDNILQDPNDI